MVRELQQARATMLRVNVRVWMPAMAAIMKQLPPDKNPFGPDFDFNAPFLEMTQDLAELSTAPVPASAFTLPEGYKEVPAGEIVKDMMQATGQGGAK
jgi:hypothetical protein